VKEVLLQVRVQYGAWCVQYGVYSMVGGV
jgi:hypothetical protein